MGVHKVRWEGGDTEPAGEYTLSYGKGNVNYELGTGSFVHKIVLNVHAPTEDKTDDV
jgi:hypothetical protein